MKKFASGIALCCLIAVFGCAGIKEGVKGFAGISTKVLEEGRADAVKKAFTYDQAACYDKVLDALKQIGAYVYAQPADKSMIAIYISESDTTPVGLFFREIEQGKTQIEVSSPSTYGKELIAGKVFSILGKKPPPQTVQ